MKPLNGKKTHPLSPHAFAQLLVLSEVPVPRSGVNPGVANRLLREDLVESIPLLSPFKAHKGKTCEHLRITQAGRERIASAGH